MSTLYVFRDGVLVPKAEAKTRPVARSHLPSPRLSRLEPYESPIDGREITSWKARDKDLRDSNSYDKRDFKKVTP